MHVRWLTYGAGILVTWYTLPFLLAFSRAASHLDIAHQLFLSHTLAYSFPLIRALIWIITRKVNVPKSFSIAKSRLTATLLLGMAILASTPYLVGAGFYFFFAIPMIAILAALITLTVVWSEVQSWALMLNQRPGL